MVVELEVIVAFNSSRSDWCGVIEFYFLKCILEIFFY